MIYIFLLLLSFTLTYLIKKYAIKKALYDIPNDRSAHTIPTPHGGGIAIAISWFVGLFMLHLSHTIEAPLYYALFIGGVIISFVSYLDDLYELSPKIRLITQALVSFLGLYFLDGFKELDLFLFTIHNQFILTAFAFLMTIWFINLYNFLDGIDGYAGCETVFLGISGFLLFGGSYFLVLFVAVLGFLVWNWHKAKIFMGDVGSTLLGYNVAIFTIYFSNQESSNFWIWIILFSLFWFDATFTLLRRYKNGEKLSQAHKKHAYQRLVQSGWSHSNVVIASMKLNIVLFLIVYFIPNVLIAFLLSFVFLYAIIRYIDSKKAFS